MAARTVIFDGKEHHTLRGWPLVEQIKTEVEKLGIKPPYEVQRQTLDIHTQVWTFHDAFLMMD